MCPFFHLRHGDGLHGWQFWPLVGNEHKDVTTQTNGFGDVKTIGGHDNFFALWPLFFNNQSGIGTTNRAVAAGVPPRLQPAALAEARFDHRPLAVLQLRG